MLLFLIPFFACWGSFLNVLAYRLIHKSTLLGRSYCPHCSSQITWYDNIPLISWFLLRGRCRYCKQPISWLYPAIELLTIILLSLLWLLIPYNYFLSYFIFFSALIVTIRTDIETLYISRYVTIFLIPINYVLAIFNLLPLSLFESLIASFIGYFFLFGLAKFFYWVTRREGVGQEDLELLAFIGSAIGMLGLWATVLLGSCIGTICGFSYILLCKKSIRTFRIPFGPFLIAGAIIYVFLQEKIVQLFFQ